MSSAEGVVAYRKRTMPGAIYIKWPGKIENSTGTLQKTQNSTRPPALNAR